MERVPLRELRAQRTRHRLIEAAGAVFAERGYERATVDDVVRAASSSKGAFYVHFRSKRDVLLAVIDAWAARRARLVAALVGEQPRKHKALAIEASDARLAIEFWSVAQHDPVVRERLRAAYRSWREAIARHTCGEEGHVATQALWLLDGSTVALALGLPPEGASVSEELHALLASGAERRRRRAAG